MGGGEQEEIFFQEIKKEVKNDFLFNIGYTDILQLTALIKRCNLFVGTDSGPMHLAVAQGVPTVALFGPTSPEVVSSYQERLNVKMAQFLGERLPIHRFLDSGRMEAV